MINDLELANYLITDIRQFSKKEISVGLEEVETEDGDLEYMFNYDDFYLQNNISMLVKYIKGIRDALFVVNKYKGYWNARF